MVPSATTADRQAARNGNRVDLLELDHELARILHPGRRGGTDGLWTETIKLERGGWEPELREPPGNHLGYLVVRGLLGRRVFVPDRGRSLELLGEGDLFRPWQEDAASFSRVAWTVLEPAAVAVLDQSFAARAREIPELLETLTERALRRSRRLAVSAAIANTVGVEDRLLLLLWQLTELWGKKAPGGAVLPFRLSHQTLADLVGARRPTVTLALRSLSERKQLRRGEAGEWVLVGEPP
jgi:CRP/FNR family transcriptional regulator, cyclic AMP receptor protein